MMLHVSTSIEGLLTMRNRDLAGILQSVTDEDGNHPESVEEFRAALTEELQQGHKYIKSPLCDNFDPVYGCLGHERGVAYPLDTTIAQITGRFRNMEAEAFVLVPRCTMTDIKYEKRELVFCKDCKKRNDYECPVHVGGGKPGECDTPDDWYCADGEKEK